MVARLGEVLYWTGCGIAVLALGPAAWLAIFSAEPEAPFFAMLLAIAGVAAWLIGRACLYVLAGR